MERPCGNPFVARKASVVLAVFGPTEHLLWRTLRGTKQQTTRFTLRSESLRRIDRPRAEALSFLAASCCRVPFEPKPLGKRSLWAPTADRFSDRLVRGAEARPAFASRALRGDRCRNGTTGGPGVFRSRDTSVWESQRHH